MSEIVIMLIRGNSSREAREDQGLHEPVKRVLDQFAPGLSLQAGEVSERGEYFYIKNIPGDRVDELREVLANLEGVEAAYVKPADELPM